MNPNPSSHGSGHTSVLIDGYNFLNIMGIVGRGVGPGGLARSRLAMLNFLVESLDPREIAATTVVFDAAGAPPGLPRVMRHRGLTVRFAAQYPDADSLIEELIDANSAPRRLTVVSSDHRLQRAARRRRAKAMDCDAWYAGVLRRRRRRQGRERRATSDKPPVPLLEEDVAYWLRQFGVDAASSEPVDKEPISWPETSDAKPSEASSSAEGDDHAPDERDADAYNPFPPGYGTDLEA